MERMPFSLTSQDDTAPGSVGEEANRETGPLSAYFIRRENKDPAAVHARAKIADHLVAKVATPWRTKTSKLANMASTAKYRVSERAPGGGVVVSPRPGDEYSHDDYYFEEQIPDGYWDPLNTARPAKSVEVAKQSAVLPLKRFGPNGWSRLQIDRLDDPNHRIPSPRSLRLGFEPSDRAHTSRNFAASPMKIEEDSHLGWTRKQSQGGHSDSFDMMQKVASIGLGCRGTMLLLSKDTTKSSSFAPPASQLRRSTGTPSRRGRTVRVASDANANTYSKNVDNENSTGSIQDCLRGLGSGSKDKDAFCNVRATSPLGGAKDNEQLPEVANDQVRQNYLKAKMQENQLRVTRDTVLSISRRPLDLHCLDEADFNRLESTVTSPRQEGCDMRTPA